MKNAIFTIILLLSLSGINAQSLEDTAASKGLSKFELGLNFTSIGWSRADLPNINFHYYLREKRVLHFDLNGRYTPVLKGLSLGFWNENRIYSNAKPRWFFSHGVGLEAGYYNFNYLTTSANPETVSGYNVGIGYFVGGGYLINDHFNLNLILKPRVSYIAGIQPTTDSKFAFSYPISLGINYRF